MDNKELTYKKYGDIINLPRHVSMNHPHMSVYDRAAQFAPFAALTGYDAAIDETARLTDRQYDLDSDELESLEIKLRHLNAMVAQKPAITVTYFEHDSRKQGGRYVTVRGRLNKVDTYLGMLVLSEVPDEFIPRDHAADALESIRTSDRGKIEIPIQLILDIGLIDESE